MSTTESSPHQEEKHDKIHDLVNLFCFDLPVELSEKIVAQTETHAQAAYGECLMENDEESSQELYVEKVDGNEFIPELAAFLGLEDDDIMLDVVPGEKATVDVMRVGEFDWIEHGGFESYNRRILLPVTQLPLIFQVANPFSNEFEAINEAQIAIKNGKMKALVIDMETHYRVIQSPDCHEDLSGQEVPIYIEIPLKNK